MKPLSGLLIIFALLLYLRDNDFWGLLIFASLIVEVNGSKTTQVKNDSKDE